MSLPESPLSQVCRSIAGFLFAQLAAQQNNIEVMIGSPANAVPKETDSTHRVNLFFYRFEPGAFGPAANPDEPWNLRLHCLITAFGVEETVEATAVKPASRVSPGEADLRLLGGVLQAFHERPVLEHQGVAVNGTQVHTQIVFQPLSADEINHIWATQGEITYRPSVAYEMALVPVLPRKLGIGGPLVGALGLEAQSEMSARRAPFAGIVAPPQVMRFVVDTGREDWAPRICFVAGGTCAESLSFAVSPELAAFEPRVWIAGEMVGAESPAEEVPGEVRLVWEVWDRKDGWRREGASVTAAAITEAIDPDAPPAETNLTEVELPFHDHAGQAVLYAERHFTRGSDHALLTVRSNPLLVNLFEATP